MREDQSAIPDLLVILVVSFDVAFGAHGDSVCGDFAYSIVGASSLALFVEHGGLITVVDGVAR